MSQQPDDGHKPFGGFESAPEQPDRADGPQSEAPKPPREVRRASVVQTVIAVILVFFGVFYLTQTDNLTSELMRAMESVDAKMVADISIAQLASVVRTAAVVLLIIGLGHGAAAHGLRSRKTWARPVGFVFSGLLVALTVLSMFSGAMSYPVLLMGLLAVWAIVLTSRPAVKTYLSHN
ncbi:hypothetical protein CLV47_12629 [Antricoccus suffuscus]|uniref:Uncharacterized protein n=1 Tax=Antricoccus suffuscus TaxID=1629062 RepID=A0A2T0Z8U1_9ACTN|nr:hypothetical protein [Antricoccus suffuscus]PRZ32756.1 hypothetical protein CLV47_12629 [Antricoccus suffuscus]